MRIELTEVLPGKWNCQIGNGHYAWECSLEEASNKMIKRVKEIQNGKRNRTLTTAKGAGHGNAKGSE